MPDGRESPMSIRINQSVRNRIKRMARSKGLSPHHYVVQAIVEKLERDERLQVQPRFKGAP